MIPPWRGFIPGRLPNSSVPRWTRFILWLLLLVAFWLRLAYLLASVYFFDEYISMLAARMVAQRGLPILPSGLFYDHGLLLSFLSGALLALVGFKEEIARWPVLLISVVTVAAYYLTAWRLFDSRLAGLLAATLVALDEWSIIWGSRARMYTPAHLFVLLGTAWLLLGTVKYPSRRARYLGLAFLALALFSHTITFLIVPPLALLLLLFTLTYRRGWLSQPRLWQEGLVAALLLGLVLAVAARGQVSSTNTLQDISAQTPAPLGLEFLRGFFLPGLEWSRFDNLFGFFETSAYNWLRPLIGLSLLMTLYRLLRRRFTFADIAFLFLTMFGLLIIFEMGALLTDTWSKSRYVFILALPAFLLLSAGSLARLLDGLAALLIGLSQKRLPRAGLRGVAALAGVALIAVQWGSPAWELAQAQGTGDYNIAFAYVRQNWQPGDGVMTVHPAAAYLYLDRCDYYANQVTALVLPEGDESDTPVDRYTGSPLIDSVEELNTALGQGQRVWFVVDQARLFERFEPFFTQQILAQMDSVHQTGATQVFLSRSYPKPLPAEPATNLDANFSNVIHLGGYSLDPRGIAPDGTLALGLYWRPTGTPARQLKVFVQVRNAQGQTVAQSDHFLLEGLLTLEVWHTLQQKGEWLRDTADLQLPLPLPATGQPYRLYMGFYDPNTLERVPLVNDSSGENAVVIDWPGPAP
ncbi:MAG: glycosyltransferase family 39 protein [Anaerolineales bacterium]|nr:glycosyltransferase family 39 protein [Anaerolineales bacterium]